MTHEKDGSPVTPFDLPQPQTAYVYVLQKRSYGRSKFYIVGICIFDLFRSCDLDLDRMMFIYKFDPCSFEI